MTSVDSFATVPIFDDTEEVWEIASAILVGVGGSRAIVLASFTHLG